MFAVCYCTEEMVAENESDPHVLIKLTTHDHTADNDSMYLDDPMLQEEVEVAMDIGEDAANDYIPENLG